MGDFFVACGHVGPVGGDIGIDFGGGGVFLDDMLDKQHIHKTVLSIIAAGIYAIILLGNKVWGWRGRILMIQVSVGSVILTLAYFGSRFVREVLL